MKLRELSKHQTCSEIPQPSQGAANGLRSDMASGNSCPGLCVEHTFEFELLRHRLALKGREIEMSFLFFLHCLYFCLQDNLGPFCFLIFLGILALSAIFIYLYLPETKGKSIMEIKAEFNKLNFGKKETSVTENNFPKEQVSCTKL